MIGETLSLKNPVVKLDIIIKHDNKPITGNIILELFINDAPKSVENFLAYAKDGFYNNTIFHRVIDGFMIQGGGFEPGLIRKRTLPPIKNEASTSLKNKFGSVAMARTNEINSATSQFFINVNDNAFLDHRNKTQGGYGYAVFWPSHRRNRSCKHHPRSSDYNSRVLFRCPSRRYHHPKKLKF